MKENRKQGIGDVPLSLWPKGRERFTRKHSVGYGQQKENKKRRRTHWLSRNVTIRFLNLMFEKTVCGVSYCRGSVLALLTPFSYPDAESGMKAASL